MSKSILSQTYAQTLQTQNLRAAIAQTQSKIHLKGLVGSSLSFVISSVFKQVEKPFLIVFNDKEEAAHYLNDLEQLCNDKDVLFYPGSYRRPYQIEETDNANVLLRAEVLNRINSQKRPAIIVTYPDALFEKVVTRKELEKTALDLEKIWKAGFKKGCTTILGVPVTLKEPDSFSLANGLSVQRQSVPLILKITGRGMGKSPRVENYTVTNNTMLQAKLYLNGDDDYAYKALSNVMFASSAFPLAFAPQKILLG